MVARWFFRALWLFALLAGVATLITLGWLTVETTKAYGVPLIMGVVLASGFIVVLHVVGDILLQAPKVWRGE